MASTLAVVSGGLDSTVAAFVANERSGPVDFVLSVDYGQRHRKELEFSRLVAAQLGSEYIQLDLREVGNRLAASGTALLGGTEVPEGHYAEESMRSTVVPNRNMILMSVAAGVALSAGCDRITLGVHAGDHFIYDDCRPQFIELVEKTIRAGTGSELSVFAPFLERDKSYIVREGARLGVHMENTWSCYVGGETHCGKCGTCVERIEAFILAGVPDPTEYLDTTFAKERTGL